MLELLQTPPVSVLDNDKQPITKMIDNVASLLGRRDDPIGRARALDFLDRAADRLNMAGLYVYQHKLSTFSITSDTQTLTLPSDWFVPIDPIAVRDTSDELIGFGQWKTWDIFQRLNISQDFSIPTFFSIRSDLDEALIHMYPFADAGGVGEIEINYISRIQRPSEAEELLMSPETREALITGANFLAMQERYAKFPNIWRSFERDFYTAVQGAIGAAARWISATHPAATPELEGQLHAGAAVGRTNSRLGLAPSYIRLD